MIQRYSYSVFFNCWPYDRLAYVPYTGDVSNNYVSDLHADLSMPLLSA
jgi:hypothetical protein